MVSEEQCLKQLLFSQTPKSDPMVTLEESVKIQNNRNLVVALNNKVRGSPM